MESMQTSYLFSINVSCFPGKLWLLLNDPHISSICWNSSGEKILIQKQSFINEVLQAQSYFQTTKFKSFIRQLNLYGFRKVRAGCDASEDQLDSSTDADCQMQFFSPFFIRDMPELLINIKRRTLANMSRLSAGLEMTSMSARRFNPAMVVVSPAEQKVFPCYSPGITESKVPHSQQPTAPNSHCGYSPDYSDSYFHPTYQHHDCRESDAPVLRQSVIKVTPETTVKVEEELQASTEDGGLAMVTSVPEGQLEQGHHFINL